MAVDMVLLLDIFNIYSSSGEEKEMATFIMGHLSKNGIPFKTDAYGNIFSISNNTPLLSSHMDTVMRERKMFDSRPITVIKNLLTNKMEVRGERPRIIGADDKCGIYIILKLLEEKKDINFLFSTGEEVGAVGAFGFVEENNLTHIPYAIVLDRGHNGDIICSKNNYGTKEFEEALEKIGVGFGYKSTGGVFSDCDAINGKLSCANLSVGYYGAHSFKEYFVIEEMENALNFTRAILENIKEKFPAPDLHKVYFSSRLDDIFVKKCSVSGETNIEKLIFLEKYGEYISIDVVRELMIRFNLVQDKTIKGK